MSVVTFIFTHSTVLIFNDQAIKHGRECAYKPARKCAPQIERLEPKSSTLVNFHVRFLSGRDNSGTPPRRSYSDIFP